MNYFTNKFLKIEDNARKYFEKYPFTHAFLAGIGVIFFWRGAWEVADIFGLGPIGSILVGCLILFGVGLFVQTFVGNAIIIKSVEKEKRAEQQTEREVKEEEVTLVFLAKKLEKIEEKVDSLSKNK